MKNAVTKLFVLIVCALLAVVNGNRHLQSKEEIYSGFYIVQNGTQHIYADFYAYVGWGIVLHCVRNNTLMSTTTQMGTGNGTCRHYTAQHVYCHVS